MILSRVRRPTQKIRVSRRSPLPPPRRRDRWASHSSAVHRASAFSGGAGFTLLEVLVALAVLSFAVVVSIQGFAGGLRLLKLSGEHQDAMLVADQKVREIVAPTSGGIDSGTEGPYTWEREVKIVATPDLDVEGRTVKWRMWEVDVRVRWGDRRQVSVATLRTVAGDGDRTRQPRP